MQRFLPNVMVVYLILSIVFLVFLSLYGFWQGTHPQKFITNLAPKDFGWEFEELALTTQDGIKLSAWFVPSAAKAMEGKSSNEKTIILLHGYPADKANLLYVSGFLHQDFNLLFLDFRYFGESSGSITTLGYHEQQDVRAALDYLTKRGSTNIGAMGFSFGGAVALLTAAKENRIRVVVSDSAFAHIDLMGHVFYRNFSILKYPLTFLTKVWAQLFLKFDPNEIAPEKAAALLKIPTLIIHSKQDQLITFENALRIKQSLAHNPKAEFLFLDEGIHGALPDNSKADYEKNVLEFFKKNL